MIENNVRKMLGDVTLLTASRREAQRRFSAQLAPDFRIFDYLKSSENGLSTCIAALLDPEQTHGQKRLFLDAFLDCICKASLQHADDFLQITQNQRPSLYTEYATHAIEATQRRIDIVLKFQDCIIGIENKPWTIDQNNQLVDYAKQLQAESKKRWLLIYLCDSDPSEHSIPIQQREALEASGNYLTLSYAQLADWLEYSAAQTKSLTVRVFVEELVKFVKEKIMGELPDDEKNEIAKILLQDNNFSAAHYVTKAFQGAQRSLLTEFLVELESQLAPRFTLVYGAEMGFASGKKYGNVRICHDLAQNKTLTLQFERDSYRGLFWGISRKHSVNVSQEIRGHIFDKMSGKYPSGRKTDWWPWWTYGCEPLFAGIKDPFVVSKEAEQFIKLTGVDYREWGSTLYVWHLMQFKKAEFAASIVTLAEEVYDDVFKNDMQLLM